MIARLAEAVSSWGSQPRNIRLLNIARLARSVPQGMFAADFLLYLRSLGWNGAAIGSLLTAAVVFSICVTIVGSIASDRYGRKAFLLGYDALFALACLCATLSTSTAVLAFCAIFVGFGRGSNGTAGPFAAVERAWITQGADARTWTRALGDNSTVGFLGMAVGATLAMLPSLYPDAATGAPNFRIIFPIAMVPSLICLACVIQARDRHKEVVLVPVKEAEENAARRSENRNLRQLAIVNLLRGAGIGLVGPMTSYWFAVRFNVGPEHIAPMVAAGFLIAAVSSQISTSLGLKYGMMNVVVRLRLVSLLLIAAMPLSPNVAVATALYLVLTTMDRSSNGPRAAITANLVRNKRRGLAGTVAAVCQRITRSLGPSAAGVLFDSGMLAAPFLAAAFFQGAFLYLYQRWFRDKDPSLAAGASVTAQPAGSGSD
ncbi:MAG TPA: MFS transporter [Burkholderiaceae bacterium]|jgi:MFS family permease|nr:MFS transporter [Burkholderiaceae bacterium]